MLVLVVCVLVEVADCENEAKEAAANKKIAANKQRSYDRGDVAAKRYRSSDSRGSNGNRNVGRASYNSSRNSTGGSALRG